MLSKRSSLQWSFGALMVAAGLFLISPAPVDAAVCCKCTTTGSKVLPACLTGNANNCADLLKTSDNPYAKNIVCTELSAAECKVTNGNNGGQCVGTPITVGAFIPQDVANAPKTPPIATAPPLNVQIPGLVFSNNLRAQNGYYDVPWLSQYVTAFYKYLVGISVVAAAIMVTYAGFRYIVGSTMSDITTAKQIILDALVGLLLVFGCYTLLQVTSPDTLRLDAVRITSITKEGLALEKINFNEPPSPDEPGGDFTLAMKLSPEQRKKLAENATRMSSSQGAPAPSQGGTAPSGGTTDGVCNPKDKVTYYAQGGQLGNRSWGSMPLGKLPLCTGDDVETEGEKASNKCCMPYGSSGCGPTALAMVLKSYGENIDPLDVGEIAVQGGLRTCNTGGVSPSGIINLGRFPDYTVDYSLDRNVEPSRREKRLERKNTTELDSNLRAGRPVIFLCGGCQVLSTKDKKTKTFKGHFMVLTGVTAEGDYTVNDPSRGRYDLIKRSELESDRTALYFIRRKDNLPIVACR